MIHVHRVGEVVVFRLARSLFGRGVYYTAAYYVDGLLVDTGCAYTVDELLQALEGYPVHLVVNTHSHEDHIGANRAVQARFGAQIFVHPLARAPLANPRGKMRLRPYQLLMWGYPDPSEALPVGDRIETEHYCFEVIRTPGHSPDHICLYEPNRGWLFCGDAYVGGQDRSLRADYNIWQIIESLRVMAEREVTCLFPGSGKERERANPELSAKISYLEETAEKVLSLHERGWGYPRIRRELFGRELMIAYWTLGNFSGRHLVRSFVEDRPTHDV
ncbi:MAG: MBL fold metallo-hydrolase [Deltaproteobacteria bacterium]|nr:MBL fold metallo-hydrolase [Deltaproteobacteria bacterium]